MSDKVKSRRHAQERNSPSGLDATGGVVGSGAAEVSRERASPTRPPRSRPKIAEARAPGVTFRARLFASSVVSCTMASLVCARPSRCCRRRFWAVGRPKTLDRPSRGYHESPLSRKRARSPSFSLSRSRVPVSEGSREDEKESSRPLVFRKRDTTKQDRRAAFVNVTQQPTWEASQEEDSPRSRSRCRPRTSNRLNPPTGSGTTHGKAKRPREAWR